MRKRAWNTQRLRGFFSSPHRPSAGRTRLTRRPWAALIGQIRERFDYCLIDAPAGIGTGFRLAAQNADMALVVTVGDLPSMRDGQRVVEKLGAMGIQDVRLIVNRVQPRQYRQLKATVDDVIDTVGARLIGLVQEDKAVYFASNSETPLVLYENRRAALSFLQIARRVTGEQLPLKGRLSR